jgi:hypothetical protein
MSFASDLARFQRTVEARSQAVFVGVAAEAKTSIVEGSAITGAPGQPVATGNLRTSWILDFLTATRARISTNVSYAPVIEDNARGVTFRNHGPHSVKLTIAGFDRLVAHVTQRLHGVPR